MNWAIRIISNTLMTKISHVWWGGFYKRGYDKGFFFCKHDIYWINMEIDLAIIGILVNLVAQLWQIFGFALQKYAHNITKTDDTSYFYSIPWWVGLAFAGIAFPITILSHVFTSQSVIASVMPVSMVYLVIF